MNVSATTQIINNLKDRGEFPQFIEGYLTAIASSLTEMNQSESLLFLNKIIKHTKRGTLLKTSCNRSI